MHIAHNSDPIVGNNHSENGRTVKWTQAKKVTVDLPSKNSDI